MFGEILRVWKKRIKHIIGLPEKSEPSLSPVETLRKFGAVIGENVDLIECNISNRDATMVEIGNNVTCVFTHFLTHDASLKHLIGRDCNKLGRVVIGNNVFVGLKSIILPNVHIGNNVVIGAGSVVTKDIPDNSVAVGNPCRVVDTAENYLKKHVDNMNSENVFYDVDRTKLSHDDLLAFNSKIDGEIVYFMCSNDVK